MSFEFFVVLIVFFLDSKKFYVGIVNNKIFEVNMEDYEIKNVFGNFIFLVVVMRILKNNKYLFVLRNVLIFDVFDI